MDPSQDLRTVINVLERQFHGRDDSPSDRTLWDFRGDGEEAGRVQSQFASLAGPGARSPSSRAPAKDQEEESDAPLQVVFSACRPFAG